MKFDIVFHRIKSYLKYRLNAGNRHGLHSPFVYELYDEVIAVKDKYYAFDEIEKQRENLLTNANIISIKDFGAGSSISNSNERKIKNIAKNSLIERKHGELLFRLVNKFKPNTILELGTSLGISTSYLSKANSQSTIYSLEGCPNTANIAKQTFKNLAIKNINLIEGNFDDSLNKLLEKKIHFDFIFIDGNHTYDATINYFNFLLPYVNEDTVMIFDDIYWSKGMTKAWVEIKNNISVTISIDLFKIGIVFFRKANKVQQHFILKY